MLWWRPLAVGCGLLGREKPRTNREGQLSNPLACADEPYDPKPKSGTTIIVVGAIVMTVAMMATVVESHAGVVVMCIYQLSDLTCLDMIA